MNRHKTYHYLLHILRFRMPYQQRSRNRTTISTVTIEYEFPSPGSAVQIDVCGRFIYGRWEELERHCEQKRDGLQDENSSLKYSLIFTSQDVSDGVLNIAVDNLHVCGVCVSLCHTICLSTKNPPPSNTIDKSCHG